jgi:lysine N6-hydroxylase
VQTSKRVLRSKNLALGSGLSPNIPDSALPHLSDSVYHIKDFLRRGNNWQGKRIAIIGGGQSGAEALQAILSDSSQLPESISWISRRNHFAPMDESVFANELFTPNFSSFFFQQSKERKAQLVKEQTLASDGISQSLLQNIYQRLYFLECIEQRPQIVNFLNSHTLVDMTDANGAHQLILSDEANQQLRIVEADIVILATGFRWQFPAYLNGLKEQINLDQEGNFIVNEDFSIDWAGQCENKIFVLNGARHSHGVADPNLSLMAWRSATIINSLSGRTIYDLNGESSAMNWQAAPPQRSSLSLPRNKREGNKIAARII